MINVKYDDYILSVVIGFQTISITVLSKGSVDFIIFSLKERDNNGLQLKNCTFRCSTKREAMEFTNKYYLFLKETYPSREIKVIDDIVSPFNLPSILSTNGIDVKISIEME